MRKNIKNNIIISGVGGQGLISLAKIIAESAFMSNYDVKTSELHGLSQRGGSVKIDVRFGKKIYSPLIPQGKADLVLSLESQESLASAYFSCSKTIFLINQEQTPTMGKSISEKEVIKKLKQVSKNIFLFPASQICKKELKTSAPAGVFLLSLALHKGLIHLSEKSLVQAIKKVLAKKYWEVNLKAIKLAKEFKQ